MSTTTSLLPMTILSYPSGSSMHFWAYSPTYLFVLAQPARTSNSFIHHPIVEQQQGALARQNGFVENRPLFSVQRSVSSLVFPFDSSNPMGWGYECVWARDAASRGLKMGIIDGVPVDHSLRKPVAHYSWHDANRSRLAYLDRRSHFTYEECFRVLELVGAGA